MSPNLARIDRRNELPASSLGKKAAARGLRIGAVNDSFEREADRIADRVTNGGIREWSFAKAGAGRMQRRPSPDATLQRKCACEDSGEQCDACKEKSQSVERKAAGPAEGFAPPIVDEVLHSSGSPLDQTTRDYFEPRLGYDFSKVRIHSDARAAESARAVNAHAYTVGNNIAFAAGRYSPQDTQGRRLLAHELTHTVQQSAMGPIHARGLQIGAENSAGEQAADAAAANVDEGHTAPDASSPGKQDRPSVQRDPDHLCGPDPCPTDEDIYRSNDEFLEKIRKRDDEDRMIRATPIEERIGMAVNHLYIYGCKYQGHDGLWTPSGEEVWQYGYHIDPAEEPRRLFTEYEKVSVIAIRDGFNAAELEKAHEQLERLKRKAAWEHQQAILAPIDQIASPEGFVQGPLVSAINPLLGLTLAIGVGAPMVHEAFDACRSGASLDCADKMVPLLAAAADHGLMKLAGGPEIGPVAEQRALKPADAADAPVAAGKKDDSLARGAPAGATPKSSGNEPADQGAASGLTKDQAAAAKAVISDLNSGDDTLGKIWDSVANPGEKAGLTKSNSRRLFNNQVRRFWRAVYDNPSAKAMFEKMGAKFPKRENAPVLKLPSGENLQMTLDHIIERQADPSKALDSSNLRISPRRENTVVLRQLHDQDPFQNPAKHGGQPYPWRGPPPTQ